MTRFPNAVLPLALFAAVACVGCDRRGGGETKAAAIARCEAQRREVGDRMNVLTAAMRERLKTSDPVQVTDALERVPEWRKLSERLRVVSEELAAHRATTSTRP